MLPNKCPRSESSKTTIDHVLYIHNTAFTENQFFYSKSFPKDSDFSFSLRVFMGMNNNKQEVALYLNMKELKTHDKFLNLEYSFTIENKHTDLLYKSGKIKKKIKCHDLFLLKVFSQMDLVNITSVKCTIVLEEKYKPISPSSWSMIVISNTPPRFRGEIVINQFVKRYILNNFVESEFFNTLITDKFSLIIEKKPNGFVSLYLKNYALIGKSYVSWRGSILMQNGKPFISGGKLFNLKICFNFFIF